MEKEELKKLIVEWYDEHVKPYQRVNVRIETVDSTVSITNKERFDVEVELR